MLGLTAGPRTILCLGAHSDDIEIGCGATVLSLLEADPEVVVHWVVFSADERREAEARAAAGRILAGAAEAQVTIESFRDGFFPWDGPAIKERFETLKRAIDPDLIFTHYREDRHQDHRTVSELTWNTFRSHWVLEYEVPKYDGDLGRPNCYVPITEKQRSEKVDTLMDSFASQHDHMWFSRETFDGLMRVRGVECGAASGYAEAFHAYKWIVDSGTGA
ncbi:PIG-L deacetylase family protein [Halofilum ochraceum]|uniref:PIG-L deacetylase family protein n=1 Tax=Halofilum ochraceum TaxID=1611323 RepID=UPI00082D76D8|nr:PIG-L deacetylase family protein [Halofilum ochraceum]